MKLTKCIRFFTEKRLETMLSTFKSLYNEELLTDCTLHCKDGILKAHKLILAASSPYFRKIFLEHKDDRAVFIMHGVSCVQLRDLLDLIYKGALEVPNENLNRVMDLAEELELTGVLFEEGSPDTATTNNGYGRDTRYKGQKRVAVDFTIEDNESKPVKIPRTSNERRSSSLDKAIFSADIKKDMIHQKETENEKQPEAFKNIFSRTELSSKDLVMGHPVDEQSNLSVWARKERKFKCDLCPSSFKRASHLSRHQLVHTGERPFACNQCDKAFSRHDKLKHHIQKAHELPILNEIIPTDELYAIHHVRILTPVQTMIESSEPVIQSSPSPSPPNSNPQKKQRGRPRKYPIVPVVPPELVVKRPRGRPRLNPIVPEEPQKQENYDISNMPYGDIEYLTKPLDESNEDLTIEDQDVMEPLVEINTELNEKTETEKMVKESQTFLENIGLFQNSSVAKICECTISMANNGNAST